MNRTLHNHTHAENRFAVIPTVKRLDADPARTGRGITIAFLDSGFYPHPDIKERIVAYHDVTEPFAKLEDQPAEWAWHGTMTSVAAGGDGYLSGGLYRGLASEAGLALVKVSDRGKIKEENIERGFDWILNHQNVHNIRIVNVSLGGDHDVPFTQNRVDLLAEEAVRRGIVVVVAAGNSGCTERPRPVPPANAPSVITVGGYDDKNQQGGAEFGLYCSSYGPTADGILKPELLAPAIWVAAPILPDTPAYRKAEALSALALAPDYMFRSLLLELWRDAELPEDSLPLPPEKIRPMIEYALKQNKFISTHYQHVDGTSFAAPIVASLAAQMLETNPSLTPAAVKQILIATAQRIPDTSLVRQGYGMIHAKAAVEQASRENHPLNLEHFHPPRIENTDLIFTFHHDSAEKVAVAGDFNKWSDNEILCRRESNGLWRAAIQIPVAGRYRYKFIVNGTEWRDDPSNGLKEPDGYGGFNSILACSTGISR